MEQNSKTKNLDSMNGQPKKDKVEDFLMKKKNYKDKNKIEEKNKKDNKKKKKSWQAIVFDNFIPILVGTIIIVLLIGYFVFVAPLFNEYSAYPPSLVEEKQGIFVKKQEIYNELDSLNAAYMNVSLSNKERLEDLLPVELELPDLYNSLVLIAEEAGYQVESMAVQVAEVKEDKATKFIFGTDIPLPQEGEEEEEKIKILREAKIELSVLGSGYLNFKKLLDLIEQNLRIIDVSLFDYDPSLTSYSLTLKTYFYQ